MNVTVKRKAADVEGNVEAKFNRMATDLGIIEV